MNKHILLLVAVSLLAAGCVYDFSAYLGPTQKRLVVEGELMVGSQSKVILSYVTATDSYSESYPEKPATVLLKGEDGSSYEGVPDESSPGNYALDLRKASPDTRYRLLVTNGDTGRDYETDWLEVSKAAVIDSLSSMLLNDKVAIGISLHANGEKYFRWNYEEIYEYTSDYRAYVYYVPVSSLTPAERAANPFGKVVPYPDNENNYYCWSGDHSTEILIFNTKEQSDDRFVDLEFRTIARTNIRLSELYYIKVRVATLNEDAYRYWQNIKSNSDYNGSLFSPNPSEMRGNIRCIQDAGESVIGFIYLSQAAEAELYIDNQKTHYYDSRGRYSISPELCESKDLWPNLFRLGNIPVVQETGPGVSETDPPYYWVSKYCADCRTMGGTKSKPSFWPNKHQ